MDVGSVNPAINSQDPLIASLLFVAAAVVAMIAIAKPLMGLYREYKKTGTEGAKNEAESALFLTLQQQIEFNTKAISKLQEEKSKWFEESMTLRMQVESLRASEHLVISMKKRLDEKDKIISERDNEIRKLTSTILEMKDRIHALELRISMDENEFRKGKNASPPSS